MSRALSGYRSSGSFPALENALATLAEQHPGRLTLRELGRSPGGRPVLLAVLDEGAADPAAPAAGKAAGIPGVLVIPELQRGSRAGPEAALSTLLELLETPAGVVGEIAGPTRWFIIPAPWPDRLPGGGQLTGSPEGADQLREDLDRNFPGGWDPAYDSGGAAGPYPLSRPECAALARLLVETPEMAAILIHRGGVAPDTAEQPAAGDELSALARALAPLGGSCLSGGEQGAGSLALFACDNRGLYGASAWPWSGLDPGAADNDAAHLGELRWRLKTAGEVARTLASQLPRLGFGAAQVSPLGPDLWQVDCALANRGGLATLSRAGRRRELPAGLAINLEGGAVVAAACRAGTDSHHRVLTAAGARVSLPNLGAGERLSLRLVVRAPAGAELELKAVAPRAAGARLVLNL